MSCHDVSTSRCGFVVMFWCIVEMRVIRDWVSERRMEEKWAASR